MNKVRKFKVIKNTYGIMSVYEEKPLMNKGEIVEINVLENGIHVYNNWRFHPSWFEMWLNLGYLEEILPDKKPIISDTNESENPYGRQIYLAEAIHALTNHEVLIKDKYGYIWDYDKIDETFYTYDDNKDTIIITDKYTLKEILEFQFDVVPKPVEEVKEKWIKVQTSSELCSCIIKGKTIKAQGFVYKPEDLKASVLIDAIFDEIKHGGVWYLEE